MALTPEMQATIDRIVAARTWNERVTLVRGIPGAHGNAQHQAIYAALAEVAYVPHLTPDFAYIHWREEYDLPSVEKAYDITHSLTLGFTRVDLDALSQVIHSEPRTVRIFRLLLGLTTQEFAASTVLTAKALGATALSNGALKSMESGKSTSQNSARIAAAVVDQAIRGMLFPPAAVEAGLRSKIDKPDTAAGWESVRRFARDGVPFPVFLHQRHYGGAFRQLLDATSGKRGDLLEQAVEDLFSTNGIRFIRTGPSNHAIIEQTFGLTVKPAPDFVVQDVNGVIRAILECKQANDGGTARDKAARFTSLRNEAMRLGGIPVFGVLAGLGWRRTADTLGPVVRDTDGRVFTVQTLDQMMDVEPFSSLRRQAP